MSIASGSVLRRILAEVRAAPAPAGQVERIRIDGRDAHGDQQLEVARTRHGFEPPFASTFHFWAHALRGFLEARDRPELFESIATHGLCKAVAGPALAAQLRALLDRVPGAPALPEPAPRSGYRMIDQDVLQSWVVEGDGELAAFFWARPGWLAEASPWDPDRDVEALLREVGLGDASEEA